MGDLISRQDAVDAIEMICNTPCNEYFVNAIKRLPSAEPQWIPCNERLPDAPTFCLVTTDGSYNDVIDIAMYMSDGWHKASKVLAWMPLPQPWKGENDED